MRVPALAAVLALASLVSCGNERPSDLDSLVRALRAPRSADRIEAALELGRRGVDASSASQALAEVLASDADANVRYCAGEALVQIGAVKEDAVPALVTALEDPDGFVRSWAVRALGKAGPAAASAVPALAALLQSDPERQDVVCVALARIGPGANAAVPALTNTLLTGRNRYAAWALGEIGPAAIDALPILVSLLRDRSSSSDLRESCAFALGRMGRAAKDAVPVLQVAAQDGVQNAAEAAERILDDSNSDIPPNRDADR